jgi:uncharacterized protein YndB with AHSA1/START domain
MATIKVTVTEISQNLEGLATIRAPLAKVFGAYTDPALFTPWWCRGKPMAVFAFDCCNGGRWHIAERTEFLAIDRDSRSRH